MKSISNERPDILQNLGDGSWHYNFNIKEVEVPADPTAEEAAGGTKTQFECDTVIVWGTPDYDKCVKAVLRDRRDETEEFSLINKYNAYSLGISKDEADKTEYENYLNEVLSVKTMVKADLSKAATE